MSEQCMICSLSAPDGDDWKGHHERIADLERQLAEEPKWRENMLLAWHHAGEMQDEVVELRAQLAETQGKLEAAAQAWAGDNMDELDRILGGKGD